MFGRKAKKEKKAAIERYKKMFKIQLQEFRQKALATGNTLESTYREHHNFMQSRQATNVITADRLGGGDKTRAREINDIHKREEEGKKLFEHALKEFIEEVGEVTHGKPEEKTVVKNNNLSEKKEEKTD